MLFKNENKDFWLKLTDAQKEEIRLGLRQIKNSETEKWNDFLDRVS